MPGEEIAALRAHIISLLDASPGKRMLGAALGLGLRTLTGHTVKDYGFPTLSEFVQLHMGAEVAQEPVDSDTVFRLNEGVVAPTASAAAVGAVAGPTDADLLRIWKSPRSPYKLAIRKGDGAVRAIPMQAQPAEDELALAPPSAHDHQAIASSFVEQLPEEHRETFRSKIDERNALWWKEWDKLFNNLLPGMRATWLAFRESQLLDYLDRALRQAHVADEVRNLVRDAVRRSRATARATRSTPPKAAGPAMTGLSLRQAVFAAIERMSDDELRRIWLPAGVLYEILRAQR